MADRYWVGGTGTWSSANTANWSATSGGAGGASTPTFADNVFFDAGSDVGAAFTVSISGGQTVRDFIANGLDFTMTFAGGSSLDVHGSYFIPASNYTRTHAGITTFRGSATGKTVTTNGVAIASVAFDGNGAYWTLGSALTTTGRLDLTSGTLDVSASNYSISIASTGLTMGAGATFNARAGTLTLTAGSIAITATNQTFYDVEFTSNQSGARNIIGDSNTFNNLYYAQNGSDGITTVVFNGSHTVNVLLTFAANGFGNSRFFVIRSSSATLPVTITANAINAIKYANFRDITAAGASAPWSGVYLGDCTGNTNILFEAPKVLYAVPNGPGTIAWSSASYSLTSGGTRNQAATPQDTVIIDDNSPGSMSWSDMPSSAFDASARTTAFTFLASKIPSVYGDMTLSSAVTTSGLSTVSFSKPATVQKFTANGASLTCGIGVNSDSGTLEIQDSFTTSGSINLSAGTINFNEKTVTAGTFVSQSGSVRALDFGVASELRLTSSGSTFNNNSTNFTLAGTGTISMNSASSKTFNGGSNSYPTLNQGGAGQLTITGANTFQNITNTNPTASTIVFPNSTTTVADFTASGTAGNLLTLSRTGASGKFTLAKSGGGEVNVSYLSVSNSTATPSNTFMALDSTDGGNNTGWGFNGVFPAGSSSFFMLF